MALSRRNLTKLLAYVGIALLCCQFSLAQTGIQAPQTFRTLAVGRATPKLFYKIGSEEIPLFAGNNGLSAEYKAPTSGNLALYCYVPAEEPDMPPVKVDLATAKLPSPTYNIVLIATKTNTDNATAAPGIAVRAVDATLEAHPLNTVRVFNFTNRKTAAKVADTFAEIPPGGETFFDFPEGNKMWVKIAAYEGIENGWKLRSGGPKAIFPDTRSLIVLSNAYPSEEDPNGEEINLRNVIDSNPPTTESQ